MKFIEELKWRGFLYQASDLDGLEALLSKQKIVAYIGFDATASSLHVGNLLQIMMLRLLQKHGHKPIVIIGGATTKIGDPSGKDKMRQMLNDEDIERNIAGLKKSLSKFIKFAECQSGAFSDALMLNNESWLSSISYLDFLRDFSKNISINKMLNLDSIKSRLSREQPLSFLEFNYSILQGYDFYTLNKKYDCVLQIGGSDQWGNMIMGLDLCHKISQKQVFVITTPLLTTSSGAKMGKSVNGAVWLNEDALNPYNYYQYWRNTTDEDVSRFAKFYAEFTQDEQDAFEVLIKNDINSAKKQLAYRLTALCHGENNAKEAMNAAVNMFEKGGKLENKENNSNSACYNHAFLKAMPSVSVSHDLLKKGIAFYELLAFSGLVKSKSEARRLINGGGVKINDEKIVDEYLKVDAAFLLYLREDESKVELAIPDKTAYIKITLGKKNHFLIKFVS